MDTKLLFGVLCTFFAITCPKLFLQLQIRRPDVFFGRNIVGMYSAVGRASRAGGVIVIIVDYFRIAPLPGAALTGKSLQ